MLLEKQQMTQVVGPPNTRGNLELSCDFWLWSEEGVMNTITIHLRNSMLRQVVCHYWLLATLVSHQDSSSSPPLCEA